MLTSLPHLQFLRTLLASALALLILTECALASQGAPSAERYVEISGKKNPEQIPDYLLWESAFKFLAAAEHTPSLKETLRSHDLPLSTADSTILREDVERYQKGRQAHADALKVRYEAMLKVKGDARKSLQKEYRAVVVADRSRTLDMADALVEKLSPEGQAHLLAWAQDFKSDISVTVPKSELTFFQSPR